VKCRVSSLLSVGSAGGCCRGASATARRRWGWYTGCDLLSEITENVMVTVVENRCRKSEALGCPWEGYKAQKITFGNECHIGNIWAGPVWHLKCSCVVPRAPNHFLMGRWGSLRVQKDRPKEAHGAQRVPGTRSKNIKDCTEGLRRSPLCPRPPRISTCTTNQSRLKLLRLSGITLQSKICVSGPLREHH